MQHKLQSLLLTASVLLGTSCLAPPPQPAASNAAAPEAAATQETGSSDMPTQRAPQKIEAGTLFGKLREEFASVGEPYFVAGSSEEETMALLGSERITVAEQPFKSAVRAVIEKRPEQAWMVNFSIKNQQPVAKGDFLFVTFYARGKPALKAVSDGRGALIGPVIKAINVEPHKAISWGWPEEELTDEWQRYYIKAEKPVNRKFKPGEIEVLFILGTQAQTVEVGGVAFMAFAKNANVAALPETSLDYPGSEPTAAWRAEADKRIELHRKGNINVSVVDGTNKPIAGASVKLQMTRHAFPFGVAVDVPSFHGTQISKKDQTKYRDIVDRYFNMVVVENGLKWPMATIPGFELPKTMELIKYYKQRGKRMRGHVLVWPSFANSPAELEKLKDKPDRLRETIRNHVTEYVTMCKGLIDDWDVTNETAGNNDFMRILGQEEMLKWYQLARAADPQAKLTFLEPRFFGIEGMEGGSFPTSPKYKGWVDYLVKNGAPLDYLGGQVHAGNFGVEKGADPEVVWKRLDELQATYGKQLQLTEVDFFIKNDKDPKQLEYQANRLRDTLTIAFAHPGFVGISQWGFWEKKHWFPSAALWRADWSIKPNGQAYIDLVFKKWWTNVAGVTDAKGAYAARGFKGAYDIIVSSGTKTKRVTVMADQAEQQIAVKLD